MFFLNKKKGQKETPTTDRENNDYAFGSLFPHIFEGDEYCLSLDVTSQVNRTKKKTGHLKTLQGGSQGD